MLTSKKQARSQKKARPRDTGEDAGKIASVRSISPYQQATPSSEEAQVAQESLNALTPEEGIEKILAYLATQDTTAGKTVLFSALGQLYGQQDPPDLAKARDAFATALKLAESPAMKHRIVHGEAMMLVNQGQKAAALARVRESLAFDETVTAARLQLTTLSGRLEDDAGDTAAAEAAYQSIADQPLDVLERLGPAGVAAYRQACLHLARLYRRTNREKNAENLARTMKQRIAVLEIP